MYEYMYTEQSTYIHKITQQEEELLSILTRSGPLFCVIERERERERERESRLPARKGRIVLNSSTQKWEKSSRVKSISTLCTKRSKTKTNSIILDDSIQ
jgi:hypothetical protein